MVVLTTTFLVAELSVTVGWSVPRLPKMISGSLAAEAGFPPIIVPDASIDAALNVTPD